MACRHTLRDRQLHNFIEQKGNQVPAILSAPPCLLRRADFRAAAKALIFAKDVFNNPPFDARLSKLKIIYDLGALRTRSQVLTTAHGAAGRHRTYNLLIDMRRQGPTLGARECVFRAMAITVPRRWRSRFRTDADHDSEMMAIAIPTGSRSLFGGSRNGDRHRRNHFLKLSS